MAEFTPTTEQIRTFWASEVALPAAKSGGYDESVAEFNRWLVEHDRQVAEKAWDEAFEEAKESVWSLESEYAPVNPYRGVSS